jgi:HD-like signal output (HDOD) protein
MGAGHGEVGAYLLGLWGFPEAALSAIALHHEPAKSEDSAFTPLTAVHAANVLVHQLEDEIQNHTPVYQLDDKYLNHIQAHERVSLWTRMCRETVGREWNQ